VLYAILTSQHDSRSLASYLTIFPQTPGYSPRLLPHVGADVWRRLRWAGGSLVDGSVQRLVFLALAPR